MISGFQGNSNQLASLVDQTLDLFAGRAVVMCLGVV